MNKMNTLLTVSIANLVYSDTQGKGINLFYNFRCIVYRICVVRLFVIILVLLCKATRDNINRFNGVLLLDKDAF